MVSKNQDIARRTEATFNTDPISTGNEVVSRLGNYSRSPGKFPVPKVKYYQNLFGDNNYEHIVARQHHEGAFGYDLIDGLGLLYACGAKDLSNITNADVGSGYYTHTITRRDAGTSPVPWTCRTEDQDTGGSRNNYKHYTGGVTTSLNHTFDDSQEDGVMVGSENCLFIQPNTPNATPTVTYPNSDSTNYRRDTNMLFNWDTAGSNDDLSSYLEYFSIDFINTFTPIPDLSQNTKYYDRWRSGARTLVNGNFRIRRDADNTIHTDWFANAESATLNTKFDFQFRLYKNANEYIDYSLSDVSFYNETPFVDIANDEPAFWDVFFVADDFTVVVKDQLNTTDYWGVAPA